MSGFDGLRCFVGLASCFSCTDFFVRLAKRPVLF